MKLTISAYNREIEYLVLIQSNYHSGLPDIRACKVYQDHTYQWYLHRRTMKNQLVRVSTVFLLLG